MSASLSRSASSFFSRRPLRAAGGPLVRCSGRKKGLLDIWRERAIARHHLEDMEPHLLRDIGLTAEEAAFEAKKPFWMA